MELLNLNALKKLDLILLVDSKVTKALNDGRFVSILVENWLIQNHVNVWTTEDSQNYLVIDKEICEMRLVRNGIANLLPAHQKGFGRTKSLEVFNKRRNDIKKYIIISIDSNFIVTFKIINSDSNEIRGGFYHE